jgi:large subunit ribosomal protein L7/L12
MDWEQLGRRLASLLNQKEPTNLREVIRLFLELAGVVQPRGEAVRQRLALFNRHQTPGPATVILLDIGPKKISAITAVRKITGLDLNDAITLVETMLPLPILTNVDRETAVIARELLETMGAEVKLTGMPPEKKKPKRKEERPLSQQPELPEPIAALPMPGTAVAAPSEGEYVVLLQRAGLLPERIAKIVASLTGWGQAEAEKAIADVPQPILLGVTQEAGYKAQQELQMLGAVVEVLRWDEYDTE